MNHLILWLYIISLIVSFSSLLSTLLIYATDKNRWLKLYLQFLSALLFIMLSYTLFYFIAYYAKVQTSLLSFLHLSLIGGATLFLFYTVVRLTFTILRPKITKKNSILLITAFALLVLIPFTGVTESLISKPLYWTILALFLMTAFSIYPLLFWKKIYQQRSKRIFLIVPLVSTLLVPVEFLEFFSKKWSLSLSNPIPMGLVTFSVYCLIINSINLYNNFLILKRWKIKKEKRISDNFLKQYAITKREHEIIKLLSTGLSHKQIAHALTISQRTVSNHIYNIYLKCQVECLIDLLNSIDRYN